MQFSETSRQIQGQKELVALLSREPPITDTKLLGSIEDFARAIDLQDVHVGSIWDRAITYRPRDERLLEEWFRRNFEKKDYKTAQKAAMLYQKNFPQNRRPYYWVIVTSYLASVSPIASAIDKRLFGPIACKFLAKSAADAITACTDSPDKEHPSKSNRALRKSNDLRLLVTVYRSQAMYKEALEILDNPRIGVSSDLGGKAWDLAREKIDLYEICESWNLLWEFCHGLLEDVRPRNVEKSPGSSRPGFGSFGDDWMIWKSFVNAASRIDEVNKKLLTIQIIESRLNSKRNTENAFEALVYFHSLEQSSTQISEGQFQATLNKHFQQHSTRPVGFEALRPYAHRLHPAIQSDFLEHSETYAFSLTHRLSDNQSLRAEWMISEINTLALDYCLVVSRDSEHPNTSLLNMFIKNCIQLYKLSLLLEVDLPPTDRRPGDDAAIMAATACIHLYRRENNCKSLIRSTLILELLLITSKHNYSAIVLIVRLYLYLGCISMAVDHWNRLDVKHVQNQTTIWILLSRISTLSPSKIVVAGDTFDPQKATLEALSWMDRNERMMAYGVSELLKEENYIGLCQHMQFMDNTTNSTSRLILYCEATRFDRFCDTDHCYSESLTVSSKSFTYAELRDPNGFPSREAYGQPPIEEYIQTGPLPRENWIRLHLQVETLNNLLRGIYEDDEARAHHEGEYYLAKMSDLTNEEREMGAVVELLTNIVCCATTDMLESQGMASLVWLEEWMDSIRDRISSTNEDPGNTVLLPISSELNIPYWNYYHWAYMTLDVLHLIEDTFEQTEFLYKPKNKSNTIWFREAKRKFDEKNRSLRDGLQRSAVRQRIPLDQREAVRELMKASVGWEKELEDPVGYELGRAVDIGFPEDHAARMLLSWRIGLDNVRNSCEERGHE